MKKTNTNFKEKRYLNYEDYIWCLDYLFIDRGAREKVLMIQSGLYLRMVRGKEMTTARIFRLAEELAKVSDGYLNPYIIAGGIATSCTVIFEEKQAQ